MRCSFFIFCAIHLTPCLSSCCASHSVVTHDPHSPIIAQVTPPSLALLICCLIALVAYHLMCCSFSAYCASHLPLCLSTCCASRSIVTHTASLPRIALVISMVLSHTACLRHFALCVLCMRCLLRVHPNSWMPHTCTALIMARVPFLPPALGSLPLPQALSAVPTFTGEGLPLLSATVAGAQVGHAPPRREPSKGFRLASMFGPVPAKLVQRIQTLQFVDMRELLPDNIALLRHMEALDSPNSLVSRATGARPRLREVNSLISWVLCYVTYVAVLAESHPGLVRSRLAYLALVVSEARRNGGDGWIAYDAIFRQNAAEDEAVDWTRLDTSLHAATFIAQSSGARSVCPHCSASDHLPRDCALRPLSSGSGTSHQSHAKASQDNARSRALPASFPVCIRWNKGDCSSPTCRYRHSCATCPGSHQARVCPDTPPGSFYKRNIPQA